MTINNIQINPVRVNPAKVEMVCTHCGEIAPIKPNQTLLLQDQINTFTEAHKACPEPVFKSGDRVSFCGEEATVVDNWGDSGTVDLGGGQGTCRWYWVFQGERVMPVKA